MLQVEQVEVRHGLLAAVRDVSLQVGRGEILALVGANGAGKSSLLRAIAGSYPVTAGRIVCDGVDVTRLPTHRRVRAGIALVPEGRKLFRELTVEENLLVAARHARPGPWTVAAVIEAFPLLAPLRGRVAGNLSGGEQQATAIGRALVTNPTVLLLDEVSLGLAPVAVDDVYRALETVLDGGTTVVLVEQDLDRALRIAQQVSCLLEGQVVLSGRVDEVTHDQVAEAYFGLRAPERADAVDGRNGST